MCEAMCNPSLLSLRGVGVLGRWSEEEMTERRMMVSTGGHHMSLKLELKLVICHDLSLG